GSKLPHSKRFAPANAHCMHGSAGETIGISAPFLPTESQQILPSPAWVKVRGGARAGGVARQATLVPATPGWEITNPVISPAHQPKTHEASIR
ncbi:MAG TPA: hypothetical protein PLW35_02505, partial [Verrucomicrobiota bacterium]|nr:hypothetical protein [Verrucomicrobiota bacterium]